MKRTLGPLLLLLAGVVVAGCGYLTGDPDPYRPPVNYGPPATAVGAGQVEVGRHLYLRDCAYCHGASGKGTPNGPDLTVDTSGPALVDFVLRSGRMPIEGPVDQMEAGQPVYDGRQIDAIVEFVTREFRPPGPGIPHIDLRRGHLEEGQEVYQQHCAACHATTGIGGALLVHSGRQATGKTKGIVIPDLAKSGAQEIATSVRAGPGSMPAFGHRAIKDEELNSLVLYVLYLQDPADHGGAPIGRIGPVVEGAVGWVLGLGVLVLFTRWIGTKAGEVE